MRYRYCSAGLVFLGSLMGMISPASADSPWASLIPFRRVEAIPGKSYALTEEQGPWLILATSFAGKDAEKQAQDLALELRRRYKLTAYVFRQTFDFTEPVYGTKLTPRGELAKMRYVNATKYDGFAVLVGDFRAVDDPDLEKQLERIRQLQPDCLTKSRATGENEPFHGLRELKRRMASASGKGKRGPMATAFATYNPLLPDEPSTIGSVDAFVERLNKGVEFSLLDNPAPYTVCVATFRGNTTINQREIEEIESRDQLTNKLEIAADRAHRLTVALRERGVEAYEYHDRYQSLVTIGRFDSETETLADGTAVIHSGMSKIIEQYRGAQRPIPGKGGVGFQPRTLVGITFDVEPTPMAVPRRSVTADYARRRGS